jgi:hypothetical protein
VDVYSALHSQQLDRTQMSNTIIITQCHHTHLAGRQSRHYRAVMSTRLNWPWYKNHGMATCSSTLVTSRRALSSDSYACAASKCVSLAKSHKLRSWRVPYGMPSRPSCTHCRCCMVDAVRIRGAYDNATYDFRPAWWHGKILVHQESNVAVMHAC